MREVKSLGMVLSTVHTWEAKVVITQVLKFGQKRKLVLFNIRELSRAITISYDTAEG